MLSRRDFLHRAALLSGGLGALSAMPPAILKALNIEPEEGSTFMDAEHVVILMQENRSFDHAFGTLRGVRGYEDPRAITLPGGNPVWLQTDSDDNTYAPFGLKIHKTKATWMGCLPHVRSSQIAAGNNGKHDCWLKAKQSEYEEYSKLPLTLGYYDRNDVPFYYAFADAFTICDQHFSSVQSCTTPNRLFLWTGTNRDPRDPEAQVRLDNDQIDHNSHADWTTFPERLQDLGVPWKIYQNEIDFPTGLTSTEDSWLGNFGDNTMEYFSQYHVEYAPAHVTLLKAKIATLASQVETSEGTEGWEEDRDTDARLIELAKLKKKLEACSQEAFGNLPARERALHQNAFTTNTGDSLHREIVTLEYRDGDTSREVEVPAGDVLHQFRNDVKTGKLPPVSWLVAPENFSDHPSAPWYGAWYVSEVLDILTNNPEVWKKTIFILTYDENDGYYDHIPPFVPPHPAKPGSGAVSDGIDTTLEFDETGHPIGLGYRVPMVIASPWSRGGHVCSEVFDHTSVLQFLEVFLAKRTSSKLKETNISTWRRTICGDLTSAFQSNGMAKGENPAAVKRDPFVSQIHRSKFKGQPDSYKSLTAAEIQEIRQNPQESPLLPQQEPGVRPSRGLHYELYAEGRLNRDERNFSITFEAGDGVFGENSVGAPFQVYAPGIYQRDEVSETSVVETNGEPCRRWSFAVCAGDKIAYSWPLAAFEKGLYHLRSYGPNGFYREYRGDMTDPGMDIGISYETNAGGKLVVDLKNFQRSKSIRVTIADLAYGSAPIVKTLSPSQSVSQRLELTGQFDWYDFSITIDDAPHFLRRYAGRVETGKDGMSDPVIGSRGEMIGNGIQ